MKVGDRIKTKAWLMATDQASHLYGKIISVQNQICLDESDFERIVVRFDDGRCLPCIRKELIKI